MSNQDQFNKAMRNGNYLEAARLAVQFSANKGSRSGAWAWMDDAEKAAKKAGITLTPGNDGWPDYDVVEKQLGGL